MPVKVQRVQQWLLLLAVAHIVGGLLMPLLVYMPWWQFYFSWLLAAFHIPTHPSTIALIQFLIGVFGPTVASWGVLFFYAVQQAFKQATLQAWWWLVSASCAWAVVDSCYSSWVGMWPNAVLNISVLLMIVGPLCLVRNHFKA